jgi:hypothetical protein
VTCPFGGTAARRHARPPFRAQSGWPFGWPILAAVKLIKCPLMSTPQRDTSRDNFDRQQSIMKMFSDNAKTYIQLGGAALALTLTFTRQILHVPETRSIADPWMILMWACFLLTILAGAFYQYLAVKDLQELTGEPDEGPWNRWIEPGTVYGTMLVAFYGGAVIFTMYAAMQLVRR